jgi:hypothetical protein
LLNAWCNWYTIVNIKFKQSKLFLSTTVNVNKAGTGRILG